MKINGKRPNFLIITTDEERFPPPYENEEAKAFRLAGSRVVEQMRKNGLELRGHHTAATACAPSRTTLYTGHYPSLHGVSQTPGVGKSSFDQNMFWLKPNTVPTLGNYFRQAGYRTFYRGKWHISYEDIDVPGTRNALMSNDVNGRPFPERIDLYSEADRLDKYGFSGWIGPEPHGAAQANDGTVRDPGFADQVCRVLDELDRKARSGEDETPFLLVSSFVNPHDIVFSGIPWFDKFEELYQNGKLPKVDRAPNAGESLENKPRCQQDFVYTYPRMYLMQPDTEKYRQFYYFLMAEVNKHIATVYHKLQETFLAENTIVVLTSDHGEMLGAHGGLQQKWYQAYEETLHVPCVISNKHLFPEPRHTHAITSHIDLAPTLLGLAGIDQDRIRRELAETHSEAQPMVGRDLSAQIRGEVEFDSDEAIYFMTDDNVEVGTQMNNPITGQAYNPVVQPNHVETIITRLAGLTGDTLWKYSRYFDNTRFTVGQVGNPDGITTDRFIPAEYECYNLSEDTLEMDNRLSALTRNPLPDNIREALESVMARQRKQKRLLPQTRNNQEQNCVPLRR
ncbi:MAG: sulfatase-like hydrolase/transferase [Acidobacteriota bacterium]|nr:sulfatase-like hydrolase/transferase [Acidobacteriota bacterium]